MDVQNKDYISQYFLNSWMCFSVSTLTNEIGSNAVQQLLGSFVRDNMCAICHITFCLYAPWLELRQSFFFSFKEKFLILKVNFSISFA